MVKLDNWSVLSNADPYLAPELRKSCLKGVPTGHPRKPDGKVIYTSSIVSVAGRKITTRSGTVYCLGRIDPNYRKWLRDQGLEYNPRNPIKVVDLSSALS